MMNAGNWNWNCVAGHNQQSNQNGLQDQRNVQVVTMDWRDILGAAQGQGGSTTSRTSPFVLPNANSTYNGISAAPYPFQGQRQGQQSSGYYTGTGIREEVEGQQPATFRIAVGNPGDLGQFLSQGHGGFASPGQGQGFGGGDSAGSKVNSEPRIVMLPTPAPPMYQPCGKCEACAFKPSPSKPTAKGSKFICRPGKTTPQ